MKLKKTVLALLLTLLTLSTCLVAGAAEVDVPVQPVSAAEDEGISPQAEETCWYTRKYNGRWQKRLWSITNQCWLTDWIDIGPVVDP